MTTYLRKRCVALRRDFDGRHDRRLGTCPTSFSLMSNDIINKVKEVNREIYDMQNHPITIRVE